MKWSDQFAVTDLSESGSAESRPTFIVWSTPAFH